MINVLGFTPLFAETRAVCVCKTREPPSSIKGSRRRRADWYKSETYDDRERDKGNLDASPGHDCRLLPLLPDLDPSRFIPFRIVPRHSVGITFHRYESKRHFARDQIVADCNCRHIDFHAKKMLEQTSFKRQCHDESRWNFCHFYEFKDLHDMKEVVVPNLRAFLLKRAKLNLRSNDCL